MVNAALDPLGRKTLAPRDLLNVFNVIKADVLLNEFSKFPQHEEVGDHVFFRLDDLPEAVIFVSHRWLSSAHPDHNGEQFEALKVFLSSIRLICNPKIQQQALHHTIFTHGGYQAAYFLGDYNPFDPSDPNRVRLLSLGEHVLRRIGVWYDYSSMPQDSATRSQLVTALGRIHELLGASNFVALRQPGDEYGSRAWCAAEVATDPDIERSRFRKICLRLDMVGSSFPAELLLDQPAHFKGIAEFALKRLKRANIGTAAAAAIEEFIAMVGADAEDERDIPLFFAKRKPSLFDGQREFMVRVMSMLNHVSKHDEKQASRVSIFSIGLDIVGTVTAAAKSVGLRSSIEADIPYTALLILYARHRGAPKLGRLFADSMQRYLSGQTTVLARYREDREPYNERCWYRFEDQIDNRPAVAWSDD